MGRCNQLELTETLVLFCSGCLARRKVNAARIVLFKSTIKLNNFLQIRNTDLNSLMTLPGI